MQTSTFCVHGAGVRQCGLVPKRKFQAARLLNPDNVEASKELQILDELGEENKDDFDQT